MKPQTYQIRADWQMQTSRSRKGGNVFLPSCVAGTVLGERVE